MWRKLERASWMNRRSFVVVHQTTGGGTWWLQVMPVCWGTCNELQEGQLPRRLSGKLSRSSPTFLYQPLTWSPTFFVFNSKSSPGQRPPLELFQLRRGGGDFMQMRRRMNEKLKISRRWFLWFRLFDGGNGRRQHCVPPSYRRGRMSVSRFSRSRSVWRPATLRPLDRPIDTSPMCRRATSCLQCHDQPLIVRWNFESRLILTIQSNLNLN